MTDIELREAVERWYKARKAFVNQDEILDEATNKKIAFIDSGLFEELQKAESALTELARDLTEGHIEDEFGS